MITQIQARETYTELKKGNGVYWSESKIIAGGGWGMRMLRVNGTNAVVNNTEHDYEYRVDTYVITSVRIFADEDITPDNRHESELAYRNPRINTATVTMSANGYTKSTEMENAINSARCRNRS